MDGWRIDMRLFNAKLFYRLKNLLFHSNHSISADPIAIIGMAGRYPDVKNLEDFWQKLKIGWDGITEIPASRWDWHEYYLPGSAGKNLPNKSCSKWGGFLTDVDKFDALFFNISPKEAKKISPEERLMLEVVWALLENSGYTPEKLKKQTNGSVGVFVGSTWNDYRLLCGILGKSAEYGLASIGLIPNRISYFFDLHGPSVGVDTLCSSSLTVLHLACESLRRGECRYAIVGGVNLILHPSKYLLLNAAGFLSPSGHCKSFSADGDGFVPAEGIGAVMLKPLKQAQADGDNILAIIRGTAVNHGGKANRYTVLKLFSGIRKNKADKNNKAAEKTRHTGPQAGPTVPNPVSQAEVIQQALKNANLTPEQINYIEAHGTGTELGDPVEMAGLCKAFEKRIATTKCPIGAVKSNVGHMEAASGIVSLIKVILQSQHKQLVPSIHAKKLNPLIDFTHTPFYIQQELSDWSPTKDELRRAGISSFGVGGSNGHVIIEQAPEKEISSPPEKPYYLLTFSAKLQESLQQRMNDFHNYLVQQSSLVSLANIAYTLNATRVHFPENRAAIIVSSTEEIIHTLNKIKSNEKPENYLLQVIKK
ncbi:polyketide synthase [Coxiella burnetii]|uniref:Modular polyketide synthase n=1 Tax=Coxiella burnetii (strain Dugway 5J108-111) TaxID=434922 RepID=B5XHJ6_COXBN|nr:polyketide synthase [Coxiella burnetii]ACI23216.1 modular polyketide synthase [Coxiella burnetii Dugway 5J108-111]OYK79409.1 polyketide synthase [Coxiella burnetii]OYK81490.1 polyketide synthase [Coxiella burnetii]